MRRGDAAISDIAGTLLMVGAVVLAGSGLAVVVATNLQGTPVPAVSLSVSPVSAGDATVRILHRSGDALPLADLRVSLARAGGEPTLVPSSAWTTPDATSWRPGDTLALDLAPVAAQGERIRVQVVHAPANAQLADLGATIPSTTTPLAAGTLVATLTPPSIIADSATSTLVAVRVSHPAGALGIASVAANLTNLSVASRSANDSLFLADDGHGGDVQGGDGVWSALLRAPLNTTPGLYTIPLVARDVAGYESASTQVVLNVSANLTTLVGGLSGLNFTYLNAGAISNISAALSNLSVLGNLTDLLSNLTGGTAGVVILNSVSAGEGTRLAAPTSENLTSFHIVNWTYDRADPSTLASDAAVIRILSGGYAWSVYIKFGYVSSTPSIIRIEMWNSNSTAGRTIFTPVSNGYVSLVGLDLNMTHPSQSGFVCTARCSPEMNYKNADLRGRPAFVIAYMRDEGNNPDTADLGLFSMEAVLR